MDAEVRRLRSTGSLRTGMILRLSPAPEPPWAMHYSARTLKKTGKTNLAGRTRLNLFLKAPPEQSRCGHRSRPYGGAAIALCLECFEILARLLIIIEGWPAFRSGATRYRAGPLLTQPPKSQRRCSAVMLVHAPFQRNSRGDGCDRRGLP